MGNALNNTNLGGFPKEYNPRIHGAYQADRFYGTRTYLIDGVHRIYTIPVILMMVNTTEPALCRTLTSGKCYLDFTQYKFLAGAGRFSGGLLICIGGLVCARGVVSVPGVVSFRDFSVVVSIHGRKRSLSERCRLGWRCLVWI
uniref:Uncharacterized protein n=1 Tax=Magallana gigas TaxID=29159 RepID=K1RJI3_MAGGI